MTERIIGHFARHLLYIQTEYRSRSAIDYINDVPVPPMTLAMHQKAKEEEERSECDTHQDMIGRLV